VIFFDSHNCPTEKIHHMHNSRELDLYKTYRCLCMFVQVVQLQTFIFLKMKTTKRWTANARW